VNETKTVRNQMRKVLESHYLSIQRNEMRLNALDALIVCWK